MGLSPFAGFGGVIIGNLPDRRSDAPIGAQISVRYDLPKITIRARSRDGKVSSGVYDDMTLTELWCAYRYVEPTPEMLAKFGNSLHSCGVVGITNNEGGAWSFGVHPAIANTLLARDAMRLDMAIANKEDGPGSFRSLELPDFETYQWYDLPGCNNSRSRWACRVSKHLRARPIT